MSTMLRTENLTYSYPASEENEQPMPPIEQE